MLDLSRLRLAGIEFQGFLELFDCLFVQALGSVVLSKILVSNGMVRLDLDSSLEGRDGFGIMAFVHIRHGQVHQCAGVVRS